MATFDPRTPTPTRGPLEPAPPHSSPIGTYEDWRVSELARKYASPDEWDFEHDGDGEIDDVELEDGAGEESL